jgi:D-alanine-D-alanine ligase
MQSKIEVGVFFGGVSPEHEVSIASAHGIVSNIDRSKFEVVEFFIDKKGAFWTGKNILKKIKNKNFKNLKKTDFNRLSKTIDVTFPILHGEGGEDGSIQGFFKTLGIPFVGAGIASSAVCLDKVIFKQLMSADKIPQTKFIFLDWQYDSQEDIDKKLVTVKNKFKFPLFVKPARTGSSVGVYKVKSFSKLNYFIKKSKKFDSKIIIEESVEKAREIEVSVIGNSTKDIKASLPGRIIPGAEFYDYDDKYKSNKTQFELPAKLPENKIKEIQSLAAKVYKISNCQGLARVDFLLGKNLKVYVNEINTLLGFTPISMYPKLWEATGFKYQDLISSLILLALK